MEWFKFYGKDWLMDVKVNSMTLENRLCYIALLCLADASSERGLVRRINSRILEETAHISNGKGNAIECYERYGMVTVQRNADVTDVFDVQVLAFSRRQDKQLNGAERQARYREKTKIHKLKTLSNDSNAATVTEVTPRREEKIREEKREIKHAARGIKTTNFSPLGAEVIKAFEEVDPRNKTFYNNTTQRGAADFLLSQYGLEEVLKRIAVLHQTNRVPYFPSITTPAQLRDNWVKLEDKVAQKRQEIKSKVQQII